MKNIFIGGVAKSGKSRLAIDLCKKYGMNHIPLDYFASSFKRNFPEVGIKTNVIIDPDSSKLLSLFISRFIDIAESNEDELFILDSAHVLPDDIIKFLNPKKWDVYFVGYPNTTSLDKLEEVKKYISNGWIYSRSEEELIEIFDRLINLSKEIEKICKEKSINFIDTSNTDVLKIYNNVK